MKSGCCTPPANFGMQPHDQSFIHLYIHLSVFSSFILLQRGYSHPYFLFGVANVIMDYKEVYRWFLHYLTLKLEAYYPRLTRYWTPYQYHPIIVSVYIDTNWYDKPSIIYLRICLKASSSPSWLLMHQMFDASPKSNSW